MIADHLGVTVTWNDMDFDALIGACTAGTIDMIAAAMFVTPVRAAQLAHSVPYIRTNEVVVVKSMDSKRFSQCLRHLLHSSVVGIVRI